MGGDATWTAAVALTLALALPAAARAHVQPSIDEDNRYLKLTPLADRVRLVYTVYLGERPGAQARRLLDRDRDGRIDPHEGDRYGRELGDQVAGGLRLEVDGVARPVAWDQIHVGLGTPVVAAGSFAVDLVAWICLDRPERRGPHRLVLHDPLRLPRLGETEIYVEESPGVTVTRSAIGADGAGAELHLAWRGENDYLRERGFHLDFVVGPTASPITDACGAPPRPAAPARPAGGRGRVIAGAIALLLVLALVGWWVARGRAARELIR